MRLTVESRNSTESNTERLRFRARLLWISLSKAPAMQKCPCSQLPNGGSVVYWILGGPRFLPSTRKRLGAVFFFLE